MNKSTKKEESFSLFLIVDEMLTHTMLESDCQEKLLSTQHKKQSQRLTDCARSKRSCSSALYTTITLTAIKAAAESLRQQQTNTQKYKRKRSNNKYEEKNNMK